VSERVSVEDIRVHDVTDVTEPPEAEYEPDAPRGSV